MMAALGLGTAQFAGHYGIRNDASVVTRDACIAMLEVALSRGIRYVDTAAAYGRAESCLGQFVNRDKLSVISKCSSVDADSPGSALNRTLESLRAPAVYGYLMHSVDSLRSSAQRLQAWLDLAADPRAGKTGLSLDRVADADWVLEMNLRPQLVQVPLNPFDRRFRSFIAAARQWGCEIHGRSAFLQGIFFCDAGSLPTFFDRLKPYISDLQRIHRENLASALLRYSLRIAGVDVVFVGFADSNQLMAACDARDTAGDAVTDVDVDLPETLLAPSLWPPLRSSI